MSHVSLASLFSSPRSATQTPPSQLSFTRPFLPTQLPSPFASSLAARFEDDEEEDQPDFEPSKPRTPSQDILPVSSSSEDDDQTELSLYPSSTSRAIPIPRTSRTNSSDFFQPSRPLGSASISAGVYPSSDSPPVYSRRRGARRGRGSARGRGIEAAGNGGGGSSLSPQPGPASLEERRRARMEAARSGWTLGERGGTTDVEDETVQPGEWSEPFSSSSLKQSLILGEMIDRQMKRSQSYCLQLDSFPTYHLELPTLLDPFQTLSIRLVPRVPNLISLPLQSRSLHSLHSLGEPLQEQKKRRRRRKKIQHSLRRVYLLSVDSLRVAQRMVHNLP